MCSSFVFRCPGSIGVGSAEGKRSWWVGRASNPVGGAMRRRVGSTPIPFRHPCVGFSNDDADT